MIRFHQVSKVYARGQRSVRALEGIDLAIGAEELVTLTGPSGSGKSTLLHLAAGLDLPTTGQVHLDGEATDSLSDRRRSILRRHKVGLVFQLFHLLPTLSVLENAALPALLAGESLSAVEERVLQLLERLGLADRRLHLPEELSGGEMQRVAVARALVNDPPVLLADEPTGNLDSASSRRLLELLLELRRGRTLVVATHDESLAELGDRRLRLVDGRLV